MNNDYKLIAMCIGIFSQYTRSQDYLTNYRGFFMQTFAQMQLRAVRNGFFQNKLDFLFVQNAANHIDSTKSLEHVTMLDDEENCMVMMYMQKFSRHISIKFIMELLCKKYTQQEIADLMGVSLRSAQRWATGIDPKDPEITGKLIDLYLDSEVPPKEDGANET
ncbi:MAG: helix-turn-helix domain-containing protein [Oscillospiraceae bacterium]|nr:helix-turn-helix domain-containing protein [Oscillospiraceae bacterium]